MSETREQRVLQAVALQDRSTCCFCWCSKTHTSTENGLSFTLQLHESECPVLLARDILAEQGTPVNAYLIQWEEFTKRCMWEKFDYCFIALSEQDARDHQMENLDGYATFRNLTITLATPLGEKRNGE